MRKYIIGCFCIIIIQMISQNFWKTMPINSILMI